MELQGALIAAIGALTGALGVMWVALQKEITAAKQSCEEDRRKLWELVRVVQQLERRRDSPIFDHSAPVSEDEQDARAERRVR
jgi:hypothetical protein